eukprot:349807-Chlamydomonas_euryale.AAC.2
MCARHGARGLAYRGTKCNRRPHTRPLTPGPSHLAPHTRPLTPGLPSLPNPPPHTHARAGLGANYSGIYRCGAWRVLHLARHRPEACREGHRDGG